MLAIVTGSDCFALSSDDRLSVSLNGRLVIENAQLPGVPERGAIGLQHHGSAIDFANLWIKEL